MIGTLIKEARKAKGLTQEQLGKEIGTTGVAIMRYEKGQREPSKEIIEKIANALNVHPNDLMGWETVNKYEAFIAYLKSLGYLYQPELDKIIESHIENMVSEDGVVVGQDKIIDSAIYNVILSKDGVKTIFTESEFEALQQKNKESLEAAILLQYHKSKNKQ